ncbi:MAG: hypothetical protein L3K04_01845 [Thermoplasmata archaeon]|nr:hypothetical protein [Thermoplasmata archaeon]
MGAPSPYLDERLSSARLVASALGRELHRMEQRSRGLRQAIDTIEQELSRADRELSHLRTTEWQAEGEPTSPSRSSVSGPRSPSPPARPPAPEPREVLAAPPETERRVGGGPFRSFTVSRYNDTVGGFQRRWRQVARRVLLTAAVISIGLEALLLIARQPFPAWWIAVLPVVWMIPVPFFLASFRGTQRVLRQVPFVLPAAP